jgi:flagellar motor switch protein FliG
MKFRQKGLDAYKAENSKKVSVAPVPDNTPLKTAVSQDTKQNNHPPGLIKTGSVPPGGASQAARFLLLLGKEEAGRVLRNMSDKEIELVTAEIARIEEIGREEALEILQEFGHKMNLKGEGVGGVDTARDFLSTAFGEEKARTILNKAVPGTLPHPFAFMNDLSLPQLLQVLKEEPVETCSIILSFMDAQKVSSYLKSCEKDKQIQLIRRMAMKRDLNPEVLTRMDTVLKEKAHRIGHQEEIVIDGEDRLAEILKHMDSGTEKRILDDLEEGDPDLSRKIKEQIHTIDCIFQMRPRDLQNLLLEMDDDKIAFILRGKEDRIKDHILNHLSSQRKLLVEETMIISPRVSRKEVEKETREFLNLIRKREEEGSYILLSEDEEDFV